MLLCALSLSLAIMGLWICFNWQGMIFYDLKETLIWHNEYAPDKYIFPRWVLKPICECPTCMSSVWGIVYYILIGHYYYSPIQMLMIIPMTAFLNTLWCILLTKITDQGCG